jgi:hypothetical protein
MLNQGSKLNWKFECQLIDFECLQQNVQLNYKFECQTKVWIEIMQHPIIVLLQIIHEWNQQSLTTCS